jgi:hypothetical protein
MNDFDEDELGGFEDETEDDFEGFEDESEEDFGGFSEEKGSSDNQGGQSDSEVILSDVDDSEEIDIDDIFNDTSSAAASDGGGVSAMEERIKEYEILFSAMTTEKPTIIPERLDPNAINEMYLSVINPDTNEPLLTRKGIEFILDKNTGLPLFFETEKERQDSVLKLSSRDSDYVDGYRDLINLVTGKSKSERKSEMNRKLTLTPAPPKPIPKPAPTQSQKEKKKYKRSLNLL